MARNRWGEPIPKRLSGALGEAWSHVYHTNEAFDGEDGIASGVQSQLITDWRENKRAVVRMTDYRDRTTTERGFNTFREAWAFVLAYGSESFVTVTPLARASR